MGRDATVFWPILSSNELVDVTGVRRAVLVCSRDGFDDVTIDSLQVPSAFSFATQALVRGRLITVLLWRPGLAVIDRFEQAGRWSVTLNLYDAVHTDGIEYGRFLLDVVLNRGLNMLTITPSPLPDATVAVAYQQALYISGGTPPYHFEMLSVDPRDGLWLRITPAGLLYGVPLTPGAYVVRLTAYDVDGKTGSATLSLTVIANTALNPVRVWTTAAWRGKPTYGSTTYLVDDTQSWEPNSLVGYQLEITDILGGPNAAVVTVAGNTNNTIVFDTELDFEITPPAGGAAQSQLTSLSGNAYVLHGPSTGNAGPFSYYGPVDSQYIAILNNWGTANYAMWVKDHAEWAILGMTQRTDLNFVNCAPGMVRGWINSPDILAAMSGGDPTSWTVDSGMGLKLSDITKAKIGVGGSAPTTGCRYDRLLDIYYHDTNTPLGTEFPSLTDLSIFINFVDNGYYQAVAGVSGARVTIGGVKWWVVVDFPAGAPFHQPDGHYLLLLARPDSLGDGIPEVGEWGLRTAEIDLHAIQQYFMQSNPLDDAGSPLINKTTNLPVTSPLLTPDIYLNTVTQLMELDFTGRFDDEYRSDTFWVAMNGETDGPSPGPQPLALIPGFLPLAVSGHSYSYQLEGFGGTAPYTWDAFISPNVGTWLSLNTTTGVLSGNPSAASTETIVLEITDDLGATFQKTFKLTVNGLLNITTVSLSPAVIAVPYSRTLEVAGGLPPYTWSVISATPNTGSWMSLSADGVLTGTPGTVEGETITVQVLDSLGATDTQAITFNVLAVAPFVVQYADAYDSSFVGHVDTGMGAGSVNFSGQVTAGNHIDVTFFAVVSENNDVQSLVFSNVASTSPATLGTRILVDTIPRDASSMIQLVRYLIPITGSGNLTLKCNFSFNGSSVTPASMVASELYGLDGTTPFTSGKSSHSLNGWNGNADATISSGNITPPNANTVICSVCYTYGMQFVPDLTPTVAHPGYDAQLQLVYGNNATHSPWVTYGTKKLSSTTPVDGQFDVAATSNTNVVYYVSAVVFNFA